MRTIPDWGSLDAEAQRRRQMAARPLAHALNPVLNAFAQIDKASGPASGQLGGLPYAAKDMLQTPSHRPRGGFGQSRQGHHRQGH